MIKLWAKVVKNNKILKHKTYLTGASVMDYSLFYDYVSTLCHSLDLPTPLIIKTHIFNFAKFNFVQFIKSDFVESVDFDKLVIELIKE